MDSKSIAFTSAMKQVYRNGLSIGYNAGRFNSMVHTRGGVATAEHLLRVATVSTGFQKLQAAGRLEWTVEALVLQPEWRTLFSTADLDTAYRRLERAGYRRLSVSDDAAELPELPELATITAELNQRALSCAVGGLQRLRRELKHLERLPSKTLFPQKPRDQYWTFHHGGREELQFNIGFEDRGWRKDFRHGVAFSLETSRSAPRIREHLLPKIARFNEFMRLNAGAFDDMRMWHWRRGRLSDDVLPAPINPEIVEEGVFIMVGRHYAPTAIDYTSILTDFDRLIGLYRYVESECNTGPSLDSSIPAMAFSPGFKRRTRPVSVNIGERSLEISVRHDDLQEQLYSQLIAVHGAENVGAEQPNRTGFVDLVVRRGAGYWYYEIKTATSAQACIRQAVAQLLEYSYWPGAIRADKLIVVGEHPIDEESDAFVSLFRQRFGVPLYYQALNPPPVLKSHDEQ